MRKTNLQINGYYIYMDDDKYYLSNISKLDEWKNLESLSDDMNKKEVTKELNGYMNTYKINHAVNFLTSQSGG